MIKKASLVILILGYACAGINHFRVPDSYIHIIPHYIPYPAFVNMLAGLLEIVLALLLIFKSSRSFAALSIGLLLILFFPVHIQMIIDAPFKLGTFTVTPLVAWLRFVLQSVLIAWALWYVRIDKL